MVESPTTLIEILRNAVIVRQLARHLSQSVSSLLALSGVNRTLRQLVLAETELWRHLDLTTSLKGSDLIDSSPIDVGGLSWRAERMDEALTEDEFYAGPLRFAFASLQKRSVLAHIQILVLDGLSVPADLVHEIVCEDRFSVRILSIRDCRHLNHTKLQQVLKYAVRPTRPPNTPKLRALYCFGTRDTSRQQARQPTATVTGGITSVQGAQIGGQLQLVDSGVHDDQSRWYTASGKLHKRPQSEWPTTIQACKDIISFDAVLCRGPRHDITKVSSIDYLPATVASIALGRGCDLCGTSPEGPAVFGETDSSTIPLLAPPPICSATLRAAQQPDNDLPLFVRCEDCLRGRYCERCLRWWCEACYETVTSRAVDGEQGEVPKGWDLRGKGAPVKVYSKLCVEHCLVGEMMLSSDGYW